MIERQALGKVTALIGSRGGKYPNGNSVLVEDEVTMLVDPSLDVAEAGAGVSGRRVDLLVNSHAHEDHFAGNPRFADAELLMHGGDAPAMQSLEALTASYGMESAASPVWQQVLLETFNFEPRADVRTIDDGEVLDLGRTKAHVIHTPGHTPGHVCLLFEPDGVLFTGDLDLTPFGPYYGDAGASLEDTIASLEKLRELDGVRALVSFHEAGVVRDDLDGHLQRYMDVLWQREERLLEFVSEPRTLDEIADRCIVYGRKYEHIPWQHDAEKTMMSQHVTRMLGQGRLAVEGGLVRALS